MGKFVGWKCDMCATTANGNDAPVDWLRVRLPVMGAGGGNENTRDLCSDKCLLKFAKERVGGDSKPRRRHSQSNDALLEFLTSRGVAGSARGGTIGNHVRRRHEMDGLVGDCLVCEFLTLEEGVVNE